MLMKKNFFNVLALLMCFCFLNFFSIRTYAAGYGYCGVGDNYENVSWSYDDEKKILTFSGNGDIETSESFPWTKYKSVTDKIVIEDGVTSIPNAAFQFFTAPEVELGNTLTDIGDYSFYSSKIKTVRIPGSVKKINNGAFGSCNELKYVYIEEGVEQIGEDSFSGVGDGNTVDTIYDLPSTITSIHGKAFGSITREVATVYGKNDCSKDFFEDLDPVYVDATTALDFTKVESAFDEDYYEYTGEAITPLPTITYAVDETQTVTLYEGFDYSLSYKDNVNKGLATITLTGLGNYEGQKEINFNIATGLSKCEIELEEDPVLYDRTAKTPAVKVTYENNELEAGKDYEVEYKNNVAEGVATAVVKGKGLFGGTVEASFTISRFSIDGNVDCVAEYDKVLYDGTEKKPGFTLIYNNGKVLELNKDYTITYENNVEEGTAQVTFTGIGSYTGVCYNGFEIYKYSLEQCDVILDLEDERILYDGTEKKPGVTVKYGDTVIDSSNYDVLYENNIEEGTANVTVTGKNSCRDSRMVDFTIYKNDFNSEELKVELEYQKILYDGTAKCPKISVKYEDKQLEEGTNYTVDYSNNTEMGTANVFVTGIGSYKGTVNKTFSIYKNDINLATVKLPYTEVLYDGNPKEPEISVKFDGTDLVKDKDYSITYKDNVDAGKATVTVIGKGSFKGDINKEFSIYKYDLTKADISQSYAEVLYDGNAKLPDITVKYESRELVKDTDYTIEVSNNINPGVVTLKIVGINQYAGIVEKQFEIKGLSIENADVLLKESIYSYDGSSKTPTVEVKLGDKILVKDTDYTVAYENNINDGTAYAVVTGIGIYTDVVKASFIILPYNAGMDSVYPEGTMIDGDFAYGVTDDEKNEVELFCPASQNVKNIQIPATITDENGTVYTVTSIGNKAFYKNTKITGVTIANTVKSIEDYAFYGCKNIKTIKMGSGVELIGNSAFRKCTKLTSIILPKSLDQLGKNVFYGCSKLKTITINAKSVVDIKANAIKGISKKAVIKVPSKLVKKYKKEFDKKSGFKGGMKIKKK